MALCIHYLIDPFNSLKQQIKELRFRKFKQLVQGHRKKQPTEKHTCQALKSVFVSVHSWYPSNLQTNSPPVSILFPASLSLLQPGSTVQHDSRAAAGNRYLRNLIKISLALCFSHHCTWHNYNSLSSGETDIKDSDKEYLRWELWLSQFYGWRNWGMDLLSGLPKVSCWVRALSLHLLDSQAIYKPLNHIPALGLKHLPCSLD